MTRLIKSALKSAFSGVRKDPEVRKVIKRFPRFFEFLKKRFTADEIFGLYLTTGVIITSVFVYFFLKILSEFLQQDVLVIADLRILNIIKAFRGPRLNREILFLTYLGKTEIILVGFLAVEIFLAYLKRWRYFITLAVSVIGGQIFVNGIKLLVERGRPPASLTLVSEPSYSFPSGHAFVACSFYGLLAYFVYRTTKNRWARFFTMLLTILLIGGIGFTRIYLGVHWPTDVLASFAAGAAWLTMLITILEIRRKFKGLGIKKFKVIKDNRQIKFFGASLLVIWLAFIGYFYQTHNWEQVALASRETIETVNINEADIPDKLFANLPRVSETIFGQPQEPINIIIIGSRDRLNQVFSDAGWITCDRINAKSIGKMIVSTLFNGSYPQAPGVPSLWDTEPNPYAFQKPTETIRSREHVHIWGTPFLLDGQENVWFGTAHFDQAVKINSAIIMPTHTIDPAIDKEREKIKSELDATGEVESVKDFQIVDPTMGKNQSGDLFFTDGKADMFFLKN
jgi:membrane-associated phospholipid phosphatase